MGKIDFVLGIFEMVLISEFSLHIAKLISISTVQFFFSTIRAAMPCPVVIDLCILNKPCMLLFRSGSIALAGRWHRHKRHAEKDHVKTYDVGAGAAH